jgi:hypothetical protein
MIDLVGASVDQPAEQPAISDYLGRYVSPPTVKDRVCSNVCDAGLTIRGPIRINYLEREARNVSLGRAGELFVVEFEKARLIHSGSGNLADRVEHVSVTQGDGLGFDIRSFDSDGKDRLIEVKTTAGGKQTPFYVSRNEVHVSREQEGVYHLYRVFVFRKDPLLFSVCGALDKVCQLEASQFIAKIA